MHISSDLLKASLPLVSSLDVSHYIQSSSHLATQFLTFIYPPIYNYYSSMISFLEFSNQHFVCFLLELSFN